MFQINDYKDRFGRKYSLVGSEYIDYEDMTKFRGKTKVYAMMLTYGQEDYVDYCMKALEEQVSGIFQHNEKTDDLASAANKCLKTIPKNNWVFYVNPDEILFDLPPNYLKSLVGFMEKNNIKCGDVRFRDFIYNYSTLFAHFEWGEGVGNYWTARRLFYWTGKEKFIHKTHFNISNVKSGLPRLDALANNEHTGEWEGTVAKLNDVILFHYGKCRGVEGQRGKRGRLIDGEQFAKGELATIPYHGIHPSVMGL